MATRNQTEHMFKDTIVHLQTALDQTTGAQKEIQILIQGKREQKTHMAVPTAHQVATIVLAHQVATIVLAHQVKEKVWAVGKRSSVNILMLGKFE